MRTRVNLGVKTTAQLRSSHSCYRLGSEAGKVSDALLFGEFILGKAKGRLLTPMELDLLWSGLYSSGGISNLLKQALPQEMQESVDKYKHSAEALSKRVKSFYVPKKPGDPIPSYTEEDQKKIQAGVAKLREKVNSMNSEVEKLCYVERGNGAKVTGNVVRTGMGSSTPPTAAPPKTPEKRYIYPSFSRPAYGKNRRKA